MHLRPTHFPASLNTIDINLKRAGIDLVDSTEHRISCDVKSAIYKSVFLSGLEISLLSSDCMIPLLKDINITGEFAIDLRSTEDRWPECEVIVERIMNEVDFEDRESLGKYIRDDYTNLVDNIVQYQTIDTFSSYLNEHAPKTLSSHTRTVCGQLLFDLLKVPPPILSVNIMVHILSMQLDSQHLLYLSDVLASFPDHLKLDDTISVGSQKPNADRVESESDEKDSNHSDNTQVSSSSPYPSLLTSFLVYHIFSSYPVFIITVLMLILFPFWLYSAFLQAVGGLLCIGSSLLYLNRWVIDQHEAKSRRKDCQRDHRSSMVQLHLETEEVVLELTSTEFNTTESIVSNVLALHINALEGDIHMDKRELSVGVQVKAVALEDLMITPSSYLLGSSSENTWEVMKQRSSPFLSVQYVTYSPSVEEENPSSQSIRVKLDPTTGMVWNWE